MNTYTRKVQYYETDRMDFVHHSNYIRWFEESRIDYLEKAGLPYELLEEKGFLSPVLGVQCRYRHSCTFGDTVSITTALTAFAPVRFTFSYRIINRESGALLVTGSTEHCFLGRDGRVLALRRADPALAERFAQLCRADADAFAAAHAAD